MNDPPHGSAGETLDFSGHQSGTVSGTQNQLLKRPRTVYKSEPCLNFQRSRCNYGGARCRFAHAVQDIARKTRLCWWFVNGEGCRFGDRCHFSHGGGQRKLKGNTRAAARRSFAISVSTRPGRDDGYCNVILQEEEKKKKVCYKWMESGVCPYGLKCCFAHGSKSELNKQEPHDALGHTEKGIDATVRDRLQSKKWVVKWKDVGKNSRIYADWIDGLVHVHGSTLVVSS